MASTNPGDYLVVENPNQTSTYHLQVKRNGTPDHNLMGAAYAALTVGYRGNTYAGPKKAEAMTKLRALYKSEGMDLPSKADDPGLSDVHVPGPMGAQKPAKKSPMLKRLVKSVRKLTVPRGYITAQEFESSYRSALGHAGGTARKRAADAMPCEGCKAGDPSGCQCPTCMAGDGGTCVCCSILHGHQMAEPADAQVCAAHLRGDPADCTCTSCQAGDPDDCICDAILEEEAGHEGESKTDLPERVPSGPTGYNPRKGSDYSPLRSSTGETFSLFIEAPQAFIAPPPSINVLPKPGTYTHPEYGRIEITPERNANFVRNFKAGVYQSRIPVDAEHQTKVSGALGWITDTQQNPDGSVDASVEWTDRGVNMLASDRFRYISPEWYDTWTAPDTSEQHSDVLVAAALCTRPFFKEGALRPLVATERGIRIGDDPRVFSPLPAEGTTTNSPNGQEKPMSDPIQLTEDEIKRFREIEAENKKLRKAAEASEATAKAAEASAKAAAERVTALEVENRRRSFAETAGGWTKDAEAVTKHVSFMESLSDDQRSQYVEMQTATATKLSELETQANAFKQVGVAGGIEADSVLGRAEAKAKEMMASDPKLTKVVAMAEVWKRNPDLYDEYTAQTRRSVEA